MQPPRFDRARAKADGYTDAEIDAFLAQMQQSYPKSGIARPESLAAPKDTMGRVDPGIAPSSLGIGATLRGAGRAIGQGATLGWSDELEAALRTGFGLAGDYRGTKESIKEEMGEFSESYPKTALGLELAGGLTTGFAGAARSGAATAGRTVLGKALDRGARAMGSAAAQGAIGGAGVTDGSAANVLGGAAAGAATSAVLGKLFTPTPKGSPEDLIVDVGGAMQGIGGRSQARSLENLRDAAQRRIEQAQRRAADVIETRAVPFLESRGAGLAARGAAAFGRAIEPLDVKRVARTVDTALPKGPTSTMINEQVRLAKESADALSSAKSEAERQAKEAAEQALEAAKEEAGGVVRRGRTGVQGAGRATQEYIRRIQRAEGDASYDLVRGFGAPPEPDPEVYKEIFGDSGLLNAFNSAVSALRKEAQNLTPGAPVRTPPRSISINGAEVPEVTLEVMDRMRREVMAPQARKGPDVVGLSRSQKKQALETIDRLEQRYLAGFGSDDAARTLTAARSQYRQRFKELEALQAGMNLGSFGKEKASGLIAANKRDLDELVKNVQTMSAPEREAFLVGARDWFDRLAQKNSDDAMKVVRRFVSEEGQQKARLIFGDEMADAFASLTKQNIVSRAKQAAAPIREEAKRLGGDLATQRARVAELSGMERAASAGESAILQTRTGKKAAQDFMEVYRPDLGNEGMRTAAGAAGSALRREIADLPPNIAIQRLSALKNNDAARAMFGSVIDDMLRQLQRQQTVRPTLAGMASRRVAPIGGPLGGGISNLLFGRGDNE